MNINFNFSFSAKILLAISSILFKFSVHHDKDIDNNYLYNSKFYVSKFSIEFSNFGDAYLIYESLKYSEITS